MLWEIRFFPVCSHHVFLSHCREDRQRLVFPLYAALQEKEIIPWLDRHDYPYGRTSFAALRDEVLKCRHVVFLITEEMLTQPRGWEAARGLDNTSWLHQDAQARARLNLRPGLVKRLKALHPTPGPPG